MDDARELIKQEEEKNPLYDLYMMLHDLIYILAGIILIFVFCVRLVRVDGESMLPTLQNMDYLALESNVIMGELEYGDVIVASEESFRSGEPIVKRVIATEGQEVDIRYEGGVGAVYVDGVALEEPYILEEMEMVYYQQISFPMKVSEDCIFVMGDNRNDSADSRHIDMGEIPEERVLGKVLFLIFPGRNEAGEREFSRIGVVH